MNSKLAIALLLFVLSGLIIAEIAKAKTLIASNHDSRVSWATPFTIDAIR